MRADIDIVRFPLKQPLIITGYSFHESATVRVTLTHGDKTGRGEASGSYYLGESPETMAAELRAVAGDIDGELTRDTIQEMLPPGGARNALDCAFWDLQAKLTGKRVWELLNLAPAPLITVYTLGVSTAAVTGKRAAAAARYSRLKVKLDRECPVEKIEAVRAARPDAEIVVDANQAWCMQELCEYAPHFQRLKVGMIEQPLPRGEDEALEGYDSPVALGADESCLHLGEFEVAAKRYDVLNIKLDKCGGLTEGLKLVTAAQERGMILMVGNMMGTSLAMAPSFVIGQYCRYVDIDGPLLLARDVEDAIVYGDDGEASPPRRALWG